MKRIILLFIFISSYLLLSSNSIFMPTYADNGVTYTYKELKDGYTITYYDNGIVTVRDENRNLILKYNESDLNNYRNNFNHNINLEQDKIVIPHYDANSVSYTYRTIQEGDNITYYTDGIVEIRDRNNNILANFNNDTSYNHHHNNHHSNHC